MSEIERITAPSAADFEARYHRRGVPVVITDVVTRWPAFTRWTPESVAAAGKDHTFPITVCRDGKFGFHDDRHVQLRLDELVARQHELVGYYAQGLPLMPHLAELARDIRVPGYFDMARFRSASLAFGRAVGTPIHWHPYTDVFLCQVYGEKKVSFYSPDQFEALSPRRWTAPDFNGSETSYSNDPAALAHARPITCTLRAGEMVYIPIHWWHLVEPTEWSIAVVCEWATDGKSPRRWPQRLRHWALMGRNLGGVVRSRIAFRLSAKKRVDGYTVERF